MKKLSAKREKLLAARKRASKTKYKCPCGKNVWGKPELNLTCRDCGRFFDEVGS